ncbi:MAG: hypothetical protein DHS20C06_13070 [Hyphobacterium sp.]|nr:MAG: hypothetical protein DHS20C06_13070 [Hyphobacterium sp.]
MIFRIAFIVLVVLVSLLSVAAGAAKVLVAEQEIVFFAALGIDPRWMIPLGLLQLAGPVLAIFKSWRAIAGIVMATGFAISAIMIVLTGNATFALISGIPVVLALLIAFGASRMR